jgi:ABC-type multidrug transport system fused ATPase/permease subunit
VLAVEGNSLERINQYLNNDREPNSTEGGIPPAHWPSSGDLRVVKLSSRYSEVRQRCQGELACTKGSTQDGPNVLHNLSFEIKSGERIGVGGLIYATHVLDSQICQTVGRTGSGKSTLTLSLLRCIYTEGSVYFDGLPTSALNLNALRGAMTIIPQAVSLFLLSLQQGSSFFSPNS